MENDPQRQTEGITDFASELDTIIEVEAGNFGKTVNALGPKRDIINGFLAAYISLGRMVAVPDASSGRRHVAEAVLFFLGTARRYFSFAVLTSMRGHQADSLAHLRKAIEACAFAKATNYLTHMA